MGASHGLRGRPAPSVVASSPAFFRSKAKKKKVDSKPKNRDEQEIPFRLREIMRSRREMKTTLSNKSRRKAGEAPRARSASGKGDCTRGRSELRFPQATGHF